MIAVATCVGACSDDPSGNDQTSTSETGGPDTTSSSSSSTTGSTSGTTMPDETSSGGEGAPESSTSSSDGSTTVDASSTESSTTEPDIPCSQDLFPISIPGGFCNGAVGILEGGGDCPTAEPEWTMEPLDVGTVFCIYRPIDPKNPTPDFCTLPISPTGQQPWEWLEIECAVVGPG